MASFSSAEPGARTRPPVGLTKVRLGNESATPTDSLADARDPAIASVFAAKRLE